MNCINCNQLLINTYYKCTENDYRLEDTSGNLMPVTYTIFGRVTGAGVDDGQSNLFMGDKISIPHNMIKSVKESIVATP